MDNSLNEYLLDAIAFGHYVVLGIGIVVVVAGAVEQRVFLLQIQSFILAVLYVILASVSDQIVLLGVGGLILFWGGLFIPAALRQERHVGNPSFDSWGGMGLTVFLLGVFLLIGERLFEAFAPVFGRDALVLSYDLVSWVAAFSVMFGKPDSRALIYGGVLLGNALFAALLVVADVRAAHVFALMLLVVLYMGTVTLSPILSAPPSRPRTRS